MIRVFLGWGSQVTNASRDLVTQSIESTLRALGKPYVTKEFEWRDTHDGCLAGTQVLVDCLIQESIPLLMEQAWLETGKALGTLDRCILVVTLSLDLKPSEGNFLFGATKPLGDGELGYLIYLSDYRLHDSPSVLSRTARHELGHALGLVPEERTYNVEDVIGLHCTNVCTMRQGLHLARIEELAAEEEATGILFCEQCSEFLKAHL